MDGSRYSPGRRDPVVRGDVGRGAWCWGRGIAARGIAARGIAARGIAARRIAARGIAARGMAAGRPAVEPTGVGPIVAFALAAATASIATPCPLLAQEQIGDSGRSGDRTAPMIAAPDAARQSLPARVLVVVHPCPAAALDLAALGDVLRAELSTDGIDEVALVHPARRPSTPRGDGGERTGDRGDEEVGIATMRIALHCGPDLQSALLTLRDDGTDKTVERTMPLGDVTPSTLPRALALAAAELLRASWAELVLPDVPFDGSRIPDELRDATLRRLQDGIAAAEATERRGTDGAGPRASPAGAGGAADALERGALEAAGSLSTPTDRRPLPRGETDRARGDSRSDGADSRGGAQRGDGRAGADPARPGSAREVPAGDGIGGGDLADGGHDADGHDADGRDASGQDGEAALAIAAMGEARFFVEHGTALYGAIVEGRWSALRAFLTYGMGGASDPLGDVSLGLATAGLAYRFFALRHGRLGSAALVETEVGAAWAAGSPAAAASRGHRATVAYGHIDVRAEVRYRWHRHSELSLDLRLGNGEGILAMVDDHQVAGIEGWFAAIAIGATLEL